MCMPMATCFCASLSAPAALSKLDCTVAGNSRAPWADSAVYKALHEALGDTAVSNPKYRTGSDEAVDNHMLCHLA